MLSNARRTSLPICMGSSRAPTDGTIVLSPPVILPSLNVATPPPDIPTLLPNSAVQNPSTVSCPGTMSFLYPLPASRLHHAGCIHRCHGQTLHRAGQVFADFK